VKPQVIVNLRLQRVHNGADSDLGNSEFYCEIKSSYVCMATSIVYMIVLATLICHSLTAVEDAIRKSLKNMITLHSNGDRNALIQDSQEFCSYRYSDILTCQQGEPLLRAGYCATYNNHTNLLSILECFFFQPNGYNNTSQESVLLPRNLSQLNDYMCRPLNRKGLVCSECADGFGPSVTSFGYRCVTCMISMLGMGCLSSFLYSFVQ
jgi:hypothetical protein